MNKRIFDSSCMVKERPKIPISPSLRLMHYNPDSEIKDLMWLCWQRQLTKDGWKRLIRMKKAVG